MSRWDVRILDVWGNARDGYEVNNSSQVGTVDLRDDIDNAGPPNRDRFPAHVIARLMHGRYLAADLRLNSIEIQADSDLIGVGTRVEESVESSGEVVVGDDGYEEGPDDAGIYEDVRPILHLMSETFEEVNGVPSLPVFWARIIRAQTPDSTFIESALVELRSRPDLVLPSLRLMQPEPAAEVWVDGEYFGLRKLTHLDEDILGLAQSASVRGVEVEWDDRFDGEVLVAYDAMLEGGLNPFLNPHRP